MQWRPCRRHSCQNSGLLLWKTWVSNTCGPTFYNHFVLCGNFCDCRCNGAMTTPLFSSKKYGMAPCHQPDPVRLPQPAPGSATPARFFSGARVGWAHFIAERDLSSKDQARAKENTIYPPKLFLFRKKEWESEIERESVCVRASMTGESSRACFSWLRFIAERNLLHNLLPSWSKRARERDLFSTALSSSKERRWEGFNDGRE